MTARKPTRAKPTARAAKPVHPLIPADRVNGTDVYSKAGDRLGKIEDVVIEKVSGEVAYARSSTRRPGSCCTTTPTSAPTSCR